MPLMQQLPHNQRTNKNNGLLLLWGRKLHEEGNFGCLFQRCRHPEQMVYLHELAWWMSGLDGSEGEWPKGLPYHGGLEEVVGPFC